MNSLEFFAVVATLVARHGHFGVMQCRYQPPAITPRCNYNTSIISAVSLSTFNETLMSPLREVTKAPVSGCHCRAGLIS